MIEANYRRLKAIDNEPVDDDLNVHELVSQLLDSTGFARRRAAKMDIDDFLRLMDAFSNTSIRFSSHHEQMRDWEAIAADDDAEMALGAGAGDDDDVDPNRDYEADEAEEEEEEDDDDDVDEADDRDAAAEDQELDDDDE
jgi:hypothetical protein